MLYMFNVAVRLNYASHYCNGHTNNAGHPSNGLAMASGTVLMVHQPVNMIIITWERARSQQSAIPRIIRFGSVMSRSQVHAHSLDAMDKIENDRTSWLELHRKKNISFMPRQHRWNVLRIPATVYLNESRAKREDERDREGNRGRGASQPKHIFMASHAICFHSFERIEAF